MRWSWPAALALVAFLASRPAAGDDARAARIVVCVGQESPASRTAADDVARALAPIARVRVGAPGGACGLDAADERVVVVVDAAEDRVVLSARGRAGRSWSPRTVERGAGGPVLFRENVAVAARSLASGALDAEANPPPAPAPADAPASAAAPSPAPTPATPKLAPPAPVAPPSSSPVQPAPTPPASGPPPIPRAEAAPAHVGAASPGAAAPLIRIEASYAAATIGAGLPVESGASIAAFALVGRLRFGAAYAFFPGATVASADTTLVLTRHAIAAFAGLGYRSGPLELGGYVGPFVDVWLRSTTATTGKATAPHSYADAGLSLRADAGYALTPSFGLHAALSGELAPGSPVFQGAGGPVLDPAPLRARLDAGVTVALP